MYFITTISLLKNFYLRIRAILCDIIAPPFCWYCKKFLSERKPFCSYCSLRILPIASAIISVTPSVQMTILAASDYKEPLKPLVLSKIWSNRTASSQLGEIIWQMTNIRNIAFDIIIPVPLHWTRQAQRGYNQADDIAETIGKYSGKEIAYLVKRTKYTVFQSRVSFTHRFENVSKIFTLRPTNEDQHKYIGKHILIVDDLMTSGATLKEMAKVLLVLKPSQITAVVACRVI